MIFFKIALQQRYHATQVFATLGLPLSDGGSLVRPAGAVDPMPNTDAQGSPCTRVGVFYVTCLPVPGAHTMAGILMVPAEDDDDSEGASYLLPATAVAVI